MKMSAQRIKLYYKVKIRPRRLDESLPIRKKIINLVLILFDQKFLAKHRVVKVQNSSSLTYLALCNFFVFFIEYSSKILGRGGH